jgi:hypothetical protein
VHGVLELILVDSVKAAVVKAELFEPVLDGEHICSSVSGVDLVKASAEGAVNPVDNRHLGTQRYEPIKLRRVFAQHPDAAVTRRRADGVVEDGAVNAVRPPGHVMRTRKNYQPALTKLRPALSGILENGLFGASS